MKLTRKSRERELTQKFIETCEYKGKFETEKPIPKVLNSSTEDKTIMKNAISNIYSLRADLFITLDSGGYVLVETKNRINPSALGQLLCYQELLSRALGNIDAKDISLVCVFHIGDPEIEHIFTKYGIDLVRL